MLGREKRLNCALRAFEARGPMDENSIMSIWNMKEARKGEFIPPNFLRRV